MRVAPVVENADLMHALQRAGWSTPFLGFVLAIEIFHRVLLERDSGITALLRAPVDEALFTDVEIARAGTTAPVVRLAFGDTVLEPVQACVVFVTELLDLVKNIFLFRG